MIGLIIVLYLFFEITVTNDDLKQYEIITLIFSPILYEIQFGGVWIILIGLITIYKLNKPLFVKNFYASTHLIFLLFINYRLLFEIFFGEETNRSVFLTKIIQFDKFSIFLKDIFLSNFYGYWLH